MNIVTLIVDVKRFDADLKRFGAMILIIDFVFLSLISDEQCGEIIFNTILIKNCSFVSVYESCKRFSLLVNFE